MATKIVGKKNKETEFKENAQSNPSQAAKLSDVEPLSDAIAELRAELEKLKGN